MKRLVIPNPLNVTLALWLTIVASFPPAVLAESAVKLQNWRGAIDLSGTPITPFTIEGTASHLGEFSCHGEVAFLTGPVEGSLVGQGIAVFEAANGDLLVGVLTWDVVPAVDDFSMSRMHFSWRDFVELRDGTIVPSSGRFLQDRPPGLVIISIIGILVGLLLPAVNQD
jgi:hypothetical protein